MLSLSKMQFRNYDHLIHGLFSLDTKPLKYLAFWNCFYSAIFKRKHLKFGLGIQFHTITSKMMYSAKTSLWWSAKIVKITALIFLLPFSESYKLIRKNPNMLELIVVILYQEFFRLKPLSNISFEHGWIRGCQSRSQAQKWHFGADLAGQEIHVGISKRFEILHILSYL